MTVQDIFEASGGDTPYLWSYETVKTVCEDHSQDPSEFYRDCLNVSTFINSPGDVDAAEVLEWLGY